MVSGIRMSLLPPGRGRFREGRGVAEQAYSEVPVMGPEREGMCTVMRECHRIAIDP